MMCKILVTVFGPALIVLGALVGGLIGGAYMVRVILSELTNPPN